MEYGPPPLFNQGVSARARLAFFSLLAIALIVVDARLRVLETVRVGLGVVMYPLQQALLVPVRSASAVGEYFTTIGSLTRDNETLRRERVERSRELARVPELTAENERLRLLLGARESIKLPAVVGEVMFESRDRFARKLVIDRGESDGLQPGMPVIDEAGVIGQLTRVFPGTAELTLLTDKDQSIPVLLARNGLRGVAFGGADPGTLELRFVPANADIVAGDVLVSSGLDGVYPPGLPVARVMSVQRGAQDQFARINLLPAAGVQANRHLLVLLTDPNAPAAAPPPEPIKADRKGAHR
ncbi:MAG: rod shape-determining protein MreC [Burkholderiaceae bacterium]